MVLVGLIEIALGVALGYVCFTSTGSVVDSFIVGVGAGFIGSQGYKDIFKP